VRDRVSRYNSHVSSPAEIRKKGGKDTNRFQTAAGQGLSSSQPDHAHLQRPHPSNPYLQLALNTLDVVQLDALPPASPRWLAPEQQQLLRHTHRIATHLVTADIAAEARKSQAADNSLIGLACAVSPLVLAVEATRNAVSTSSRLDNM
jgi:hypothetical protein